MASWNELRTFIQANYEIADDSGDLIKMIFGLGDGSRSQIVIVGRNFNEGTGEEWVAISSPIGLVSSVDITAAARRAFEVLCGGIVVINDMVYLHHATPLVSLDNNEFVRPLSIVVTQADEIERALLGTDEY